MSTIGGFVSAAGRHPLVSALVSGAILLGVQQAATDDKKAESPIAGTEQPARGTGSPSPLAQTGADAPASEPKATPQAARPNRSVRGTWEGVTREVDDPADKYTVVLKIRSTSPDEAEVGTYSSFNLDGSPSLDCGVTATGPAASGYGFALVGDGDCGDVEFTLKREGQRVRFKLETYGGYIYEGNLR